MDLMRLNKSTYLGEEGPVEGYTSLIWTERFLPAGDFQLTTPLIAQTRAELPLDSLVAIRESKEVMLVESHSIKVDDDGVKNLVVKGRTAESFLEQRNVRGGQGTPNPMMQNSFSSVRLVAALIHEFFVNATGSSVVFSNQYNPGPVARAFLDDGVIPNLRVAASASTNTPVKRQVDKGPVYKQILDLAVENDLGIRCIRPPSAQPALFSISAAGVTSITNTPTVNALVMDVYRGLDRTRLQAVNAPVIFHHEQGHIADPEQIFSIKELKNVGMVDANTAPPISGDAYWWNDDYSVTGWNKRELYYDAGDEWGAVSPAVANDRIIQKMAAEVRKTRDIAFFNGEISPLAPYKYKTDYDLGDKVTLLSGNGPEESVYVSEYIRTEDADGDRGFPTLVSSLM